MWKFISCLGYRKIGEYFQDAGNVNSSFRCFIFVMREEIEPHFHAWYRRQTFFCGVAIYTLFAASKSIAKNNTNADINLMFKCTISLLVYECVIITWAWRINLVYSKPINFATGARTLCLWAPNQLGVVYVAYERVKSETQTDFSDFMSALLASVLLTAVCGAIHILICSAKERWVLSFIKLWSVFAWPQQYVHSLLENCAKKRLT